ncbi:RAQPRD family integrative conjugative element protein [Vibrio europaeus]|uniref:RAQPRD family integrative conjugative element protein n=1 Tax=Vibrio europaeus TaxID=300876 RepID=UPI00233E976D|nr:RAQPRD family integrative conjugative element protein [Vibrio europaeus]MDC5870286.1 RAQPRD family integrative conjugative element protein [Vibrio europaeus]
MKKAVLLLVLLCAFNAHAISPEEKEHLALIVQDMEVLKYDIQSIEDRFAKSDDANKFKYKEVIKDLNLISDGIKRRVSEHSNQPVNFDEIKGNY